MNEKPLDAHREKMIAALYGELSAEEERELRELIDSDEELLAEWQELAEAREFLRAAGDEAPAPSFVFLTPPEEALPASATVRAGCHARSGLRARLGHLFGSPAVVFGIAACALLVLIGAGFRVDHTEAGLVLGFGSRPHLVAPPQFAEGVSLEPGSERASGTLPIVPVSATADAGAYMTRTDFDRLANLQMKITAAMLNQYEEQRRDETLLLVRQVSATLSQRQQRNHEELRTQVQDAWLGMIGAGALGNQPVMRSSRDRGTPERIAPVSQPTDNRKGEMRDD
jgi:hypothetical protein